MLDSIQPLLPLLDLSGHDPAPPRPRRARAKVTARPLLAPEAPPDAFQEARLRALRQAFVGLAARWALSGSEALELLGEPRAGAQERHERLCLLVSVHRLMLLAWPEPGRCQAELRRASPAFDGAAPLPLMLAEGPRAMERVRDHLVRPTRV